MLNKFQWECTSLFLWTNQNRVRHDTGDNDWLVDEIDRICLCRLFDIDTRTGTKWKIEIQTEKSNWRRSVEFSRALFFHTEHWSSWTWDFNSLLVLSFMIIFSMWIYLLRMSFYDYRSRRFHRTAIIYVHTRRSPFWNWKLVQQILLDIHKILLVKRLYHLIELFQMFPSATLRIWTLWCLLTVSSRNLNLVERYVGFLSE